MIKHIWKIIWNERKHNIGLWIELVIVACFLWYIVDNIYVTLNNYYKPLGFDTEHTYIMHFGVLDPDNDESEEDIPQASNAEQLESILDRIQHNPMIEAASISIHSSPHIGSNRNDMLFADTLQTPDAILTRMVTPDFFKVFKYKSTNGSTEELVQVLKKNEIIISQNIEKELFPNGISAVGKQISIGSNDSTNRLRVGAISTNIRYDNFWSDNSYCAIKLDNNVLSQIPDGYVSMLEFCVRVKPEEDYDFIHRFRKEMTQQLRIGNYYLADIQYIPTNKKAFQKDNINDLKIRMFIIIFLLINIFLGITGIFWFRTQHRRGEIGLRISMGDTPKQILKKYYTEGIILLSAAMIPAMIVIYILGKREILITYLMYFTLSRYLIGFCITYLLLSGMIILGIWFPARKAIRVSPSEAIRDE